MEKQLPSLAGSPRCTVVTPATLTVTPGQVQYINGQPFFVQVGPRQWPGFRALQARLLGAVLVVCALISALLNIVGLTLYNGWEFSAFMIGHGFVGLIFYTLAGSFAISAAKKKTTCKIVSTLVLCIIAIIFGGIIQIVASSAGVGMSATKYLETGNPWGMCGVGMYGPDYMDYDDVMNDDEWRNPSNITNNQNATDPGFPVKPIPAMRERERTDYDGFRGNDYRDRDGVDYPAFIAIHVIMLIAGLTQFISAIWCSSICCASVCCCKKPTIAQQHIPVTFANSRQTAYAPGTPVAPPLYAASPPAYTSADTKSESEPQA